MIKFLKIGILLFIVFSLSTERIIPCTMITAENDTIVLAGNNEDYSDPNTFVWFINKNEDRKYGCIYLGYSNLWPQGGMNEAGLCFDAFATAPNPVPVINFENLPLFTSNPMDQVMSSCSSVLEAVTMMQQHDLSFMTNFQLMLVDKLGNSAIIEGEEVIWKNDYYQVCTNFYQSNPSLGGYPCWRYDTAVELFEDHQDSVSIPLFRDILNATHQEGQYPTLYTNIYDLHDGKVYLYYNHYYDEVVIFDLLEGLGRGNREYQILDLYSNLIIQSPDDGAIIESNSATLIWEGEGEKYHLLYSLDPDFNDYEEVEINMSDYSGGGSAVISLGLVLFIPFILSKNNTVIRKSILIVPMIFISLFTHSCNLNNVTSSNEKTDITSNGNSVSVTIHSLEADTTYYWQVKAERNGPFISEGPINKFTVK